MNLTAVFNIFLKDSFHFIYYVDMAIFTERFTYGSKKLMEVCF